MMVSRREKVSSVTQRAPRLEVVEILEMGDIHRGTRAIGLNSIS